MRPTPAIGREIARHTPAASKPWRTVCVRRSSARITSVVVCAIVLVVDASPSTADIEATSEPFVIRAETEALANRGPRTPSKILDKRIELDLRLRTSLIYQPGWLDSRANRGRSIFAAVKGDRALHSASNVGDAPGAVRWSNWKDFAFPQRAVSVGHAVRDGLFLNLNVGLEQEVDRERVGRPMPRVGLQFEGFFD